MLLQGIMNPIQIRNRMGHRLLRLDVVMMDGMRTIMVVVDFRLVEPMLWCFAEFHQITRSTRMETAITPAVAAEPVTFGV